VIKQIKRLEIQNFDTYLNYIFGGIFFVNIFLFTNSFTFEFVRNLSELFLYITAIVFLAAIYLSYKFQLQFNRINFAIWFFSTFTLTLILEMVGTASGLIFGEYSYGQVLQFQLFNAPVIIGLNWVILILSATEIAKSILDNINKYKNKDTNNYYFFIGILAAVLTTLFDYILEPVAVYLGYWNWGNLDIYKIPFKNYIAWFVISIIFSWFYLFLKIKIKSSFVRNIFWMQFIFFLALRIYLVL
jgi:bisanhydrobacterioruberin hydratase